MKLTKLERLAVAMMEVMGDPDVDLDIRKKVRLAYDAIEAHSSRSDRGSLRVSGSEADPTAPARADN